MVGIGETDSILDLVHKLAPAIPARYDVRNAQAHFDGVMRVLQVRSEILGRVFNVRKNRAKMLILEGEAQIGEQLQGGIFGPIDEALQGWITMDDLEVLVQDAQTQGDFLMGPGGRNCLGSLPGLQDLYENPGQQPGQEEIPGAEGLFILAVGQVDHPP